MTEAQFDKALPAFEKKLKEWFDDESEDFDAAVGGMPAATSPIFGGVPAMDSKAVVKASPIVQKFFGENLDPNDIRPGGYSSFDDLYNDLVPKLRKRFTATDEQPTVSH